jgi:hypothetical protein
MKSRGGQKALCPLLFTRTQTAGFPSRSLELEPVVLAKLRLDGGCCSGNWNCSPAALVLSCSRGPPVGGERWVISSGKAEGQSGGYIGQFGGQRQKGV